ncbi:MAG: hypothetical protein ACRDL2_10340 [Gaiellaceae bacterium]
MARRDKILEQMRYELSGSDAAQAWFTQGMAGVSGLTAEQRADLSVAIHSALRNGILALADEIDALEVSVRPES